MVRETEPEVLLAQRLARHPQLCARVERLLAVVEDAAGDVVKADAAERRVIEELRHMGQEALTAWAERGVGRIEAEAAAEPGSRRGGKKTPLAHDLRNDHGAGADLSGRNAGGKALLRTDRG